MLARRTIVVATVLLFSIAVTASVATWRNRTDIAVTASVATWRNRTDSAARTRMFELKSKVEGKKVVSVLLPQFFFIVGKPTLTSSIKRTLREHNEGLSQEYWRLRRRRDFLQDIKPDLNPNPDQVVITATIDEQNKYMADCVTFGVEAIVVQQPNGKTKYFAIHPTIGGSIETFDTKESMTPQRKQRVFSRADFVNPGDIDWFFDVKDFSTYRHN